ncbi:ExbD/TolR family protein [Sinimarinibacterium sp. CAU 1509]|uniref:ExbD/TolR family protein n=1 Tax=Sinimarinibacterium sp. CAU 1509 TaxID=2562283 RepID=UPI00200B5F05|nr:biopolymer transporter ExbD [Sinimarinibacterium sp. CAU 1509]
MIRAHTLRTQRLERRRKRNAKHGTLSLTSLMDIFTILVFFLLVNSSQVEVLPSPRSLELPASVATDGPREAVLLMVSKEDVLVNGELIMSVTDAANTTGNVLGPLKSRLLQEGLLPVVGAESGAVSRGEINIMADKDIPYQLIKKIMATCSEARFAKISLAVAHHEAGGDS